jgi:magnesium-transporting ATPase (P-type)
MLWGILYGMSIRQRFYITLVFAFIIISIHKIATELYLYWIYRWFDIPMHILGGLMVGLFTFILCRYQKWSESSRNILAGVFLVGISWEILEVALRVVTMGTESYALDTCKDLLDDIIGGILSIYIWRKIPN